MTTQFSCPKHGPLGASPYCKDCDREATALLNHVHECAKAGHTGRRHQADAFRDDARYPLKVRGPEKTTETRI